MNDQRIAPEMTKHVLWTASIVRKIGRLDLSEADLQRFLARIGEIMSEYNLTTARMEFAWNEAMRAISETWRQRGESIESEYQALVQTVKSDYERVLSPLTAYRETIVAERDAILDGLRDQWNAAVAAQKAEHATVTARIEAELLRYQKGLFRSGKEAVAELLVQTREEPLSTQAKQPKEH